MDRVGVLVVSKCLSAAAMIDTISRSSRYEPEFYVAEKQANPFNSARAKVHKVLPGLEPHQVARFARRYRKRIDFGLVDTEEFVVAGGRDVVEKEAGVPMVCVAGRYAVERSKAEQRSLFSRIFRQANPPYKVFNPGNRGDKGSVIAELRRTAARFGEMVVKPDAPARGAGVGVWGKDIRSEHESEAFFLSLLAKGRVVVEKKVEGEESSFQAFSDGKHFVAAPLTRDYKRSLNVDSGRLTGGMGSYRGDAHYLPFLRESDWDHLLRAEEAAFRKWRGKGSNPGLRGVVLYDAIMHTGAGFNVLERNSRGGNTEVINVLTTMADDFVDVCYKILDGSLKGIRFRRQASVVTCGVPRSYGTERPATEGLSIDLSRAYSLVTKERGGIRVFPMDVRQVGDESRIGSSRSVAVVGLADSLESARRSSLAGVRAVAGPLRWRTDIASAGDVSRSAAHLRALRRMA